MRNAIHWDVQVATTTGPLGSAAKKKIVVVEDVYGKLKAPDSILRHIWKKTEVDKVKQTFNNRDPLFKPKTSSIRSLPMVTLSGENAAFARTIILPKEPSFLL